MGNQTQRLKDLARRFSEVSTWMDQNPEH